MAYEAPSGSLSLPEPPSASPSALTQPQVKAFAELKALCGKNDVYWPASELEDHPAHGSNADNDLLYNSPPDDLIFQLTFNRRYLRARSYDPQAAYKQYSTSAAWRRKYKLDETYDNAEIEKFGRMNGVVSHSPRPNSHKYHVDCILTHPAQQQPQWTGRRDKKGLPLMVYVISEIRPEDLSQIAKDDPELSSIFLPAEYVTRFTQRLCTQLPHPTDGHGGVIIDKTTNIVDLSNVGLRKFWTLRSLLQTASSMATAHYPETVERIFVVGAPYFFPTIWSLATRWFDPATTRKIVVLQASQATATLRQFIEPENLPKRFGGSLDWAMGMHPILDAETKSIVGRLADTWIEGPIRYISRPEGDVLMAVGSEDGKVRRDVLAEFLGKQPPSVPLSHGL